MAIRPFHAQCTSRSSLAPGEGAGTTIDVQLQVQMQVQMQVQGAGNTAVVKVQLQVQVGVFTWEADERKLQPLSPALPASHG